MSFYYLAILVTYSVNDGTYTVRDTLAGRPIGFCDIHEGPGWLYCPTTLSPLMAEEIRSISDLLEDLNSTLE